MMKQQNNSQTAFTLMELMVVVSLVLIILGVGMTNYITQMKRSRDARRKSDLEQIRAALEMYRADNGRYVLQTPCWNNIDGTDNLSSELVSGGYMSEVPQDPLNNVTNPGPCGNEKGYRYNYMSINSGQGYVLTAIMEREESNDESPCSELSNWGSVCWCSSPPFATEDYCYGVQNP